MKKVISAWFGGVSDRRTRMQMIRAAGFDGIMLWSSDSNMLSDGADSALCGIARSVGLEIENAHLPFTGINDMWLDNDDGDRYEAFLSEQLDLCAQNDIPCAVMHLSRSFSPPPYNDIGLARFMRLTEKAEKLGIQIAYENLRLPEYLDFIMDNIKSPAAGVCCDIGHNRCFSPQRSILRDYAEKIIAIHLHDNDGSGDQHLLPFDGVIDWDTVAGDLLASAYKGSLALEVENTGHYLGDPEGFLTAAYQRARMIELRMEALAVK